MKWLLLILLSAMAANATTYYVAKTGSDSNNGSQGSPFLTVQKGIDTARAGDTVLVGAGDYRENVQNRDWAGTTNSPITINGQSVATVGSWNLGEPFINILNFTITGGTNLLGRGLLYMMTPASWCVISNCNFDSVYDHALYRTVEWDGPLTTPFGTAASSNLFVNNIFQRTAGERIFGIYGNYNLVLNNTLINSDQADFFQVYGLSNSIVGNLCSNLWESFTVANHADFFQAFLGGAGQGSKGHLVESNIVIKMDNRAQLANITDDTDSGYHIFRNNLFIGIAAKASCASPGIQWLNNVFFQCGTNHNQLGASPDGDPNGDTPLLTFCDCGGNGHGHNGRVLNNIFLDCGWPEKTNNGCGWYTFDTTLTNVIADFNYIGKDGYKAIDIDSQHRAVGAPGGWAKFNWWETNGINGGDPKFDLEGRGGFHPLASSFLVGVGTNLNAQFTTDLAGVTRGSSWDIGAYEYVDFPMNLPDVRCDLATRSVQGYPLCDANSVLLRWPSNQFGNQIRISRRTYTNNPNYWPAWTALYTNTVYPLPKGEYYDTNISSGVAYEYEIRTSSTNYNCGVWDSYGYYGFQYLLTGYQIPLRDMRGSVILLVEQGITNALVTEIATLVADLRGDGYKVYRHDVAAKDVTESGWATAVTTTKALIVTDYLTAPGTNWTVFIVGHVPIPYSGDSSPGSHSDNVGAHPADWYYADTNASSWTDSTVNDSTSDSVADHNVPSDGKFDQSNVPTMPEMRLGRIDLRNMPAFGKTEVQLLSQYLNRNHQWRHKQFTVRDRALVGTNSAITTPPYDVYGIYSSLFGVGTNYDVGSWTITTTNSATSYLLASSASSGSYTHDSMLGDTTNFAATSVYSVFNSQFGSYYGDWDSSQHSNDVMHASLCSTGYSLAVYYRDNVGMSMNPSTIGEPYSDDLWFMAAAKFQAADSTYIQRGYYYTNNSSLNLSTDPVQNFTGFFGDPTLRLHQAAPPTGLVASTNGNDIVLTWTAASDPNVQGYHIYRAPSADLNSFTRLTSTPTNSPYTNVSGALASYGFWVRTINLENSVNRSYYQASQGVFTNTAGSAGTGESIINVTTLNKR